MKKITSILALLILTLAMAACGPATPSGNDTTATPGMTETSTAETPMDATTATPSTFTGNVDELIAMVNGYVTSGEITGQAENGLLAKLETINKKVMNGQMDPAANEMGSFINEVQAQAGKKISNAAATALITKAQAIAAEFMAGIPVTGDSGTAIPPTVLPTEATLATMSKPTAMGDQLRHQVQWDAVAQQVVQSVGFSTFDYDLFRLPANTAWENTLTYYKTQAAAAGWGDAPIQTNEFAGGNYAVWSMAGSDGSTNYFVVAQMDTSDGAYTVNIFGNK
ncbi:MAG: hypothetical protein IPP66_15330 [Anaerolineales bacterium]|nr:hypothetical protein [Anaerolineales bacterium]